MLAVLCRLFLDYDHINRLAIVAASTGLVIRPLTAAVIASAIPSSRSEVFRIQDENLASSGLHLAKGVCGNKGTQVVYLINGLDPIN